MTWSTGGLTARSCPFFLQRFFDPLPAGLPVPERRGPRSSANRFARWCAKVQNSFHKRKIDLRAYGLRRRLASHLADVGRLGEARNG